MRILKGDYTLPALHLAGPASLPAVVGACLGRKAATQTTIRLASVASNGSLIEVARRSNCSRVAGVTTPLASTTSRII